MSALPAEAHVEPTAAGPGDRPLWALDGRDWPLREHSRFVDAGGLRWHVQQYGHGPELLLFHGVAAATHSWRDLGPLLAERFRVTALDLPGHGFTSAPQSSTGFSPSGMAAALGGLLQRLEVEPALIVGHSAGAALGAALCLDKHASPARLIALNGALSAQHAFSAALFPQLARMASQPLVAQLFAWRADRSHVERVIASTGSSLDDRGVELYRRLFTRRAHVSAAFSMMASWSQGGVLDRLTALDTGLSLIAARDDLAIPFRQARALAARTPGAELHELADGGHLAHEQRPQAVAELIAAIAERALEPGAP